MSSGAARLRVAVIGAGVAGTTCAAALRGQVAAVTVFERGAAPGGRLRSPTPAWQDADPGAQYFTVRNPIFSDCVQAWQHAGLASRWDGWVVDLARGQISARSGDPARFVGLPDMAALVTSLAGGLDLRASCGVEEIERDGEGWSLFDGEGRYLGRFDRVVTAVAASDAGELLTASPAMVAAVREIEMAPCWSVLLRYESGLALPFDAAYVLQSELSWLARTSSKPRRTGLETWVLHASPEWSQRHLIALGAEVLGTLLPAFAEAAGERLPVPVDQSAFLWRSARPINPLGQDCLYDPGLGLGACGDWCLGPRIESAFLSGFAMADRLLQG